MSTMIEVICYNTKNKHFELCLIATLNKETNEIYKQFFNILKTNYNFKPNIVICHICIVSINAIKDVFNKDKTIIIICFFHLIKSWWRNA